MQATTTSQCKVHPVPIDWYWELELELKLEGQNWSQLPHTGN